MGVSGLAPGGGPEVAAGAPEGAFRAGGGSRLRSPPPSLRALPRSGPPARRRRWRPSACRHDHVATPPGHCPPGNSSGRRGGPDRRPNESATARIPATLDGSGRWVFLSRESDSAARSRRCAPRPMCTHGRGCSSAASCRGWLAPRQYPVPAVRLETAGVVSASALSAAFPAAATAVVTPVPAVLTWTAARTEIRDPTSIFPPRLRCGGAGAARIGLGPACAPQPSEDDLPQVGVVGHAPHHFAENRGAAVRRAWRRASTCSSTSKPRGLLPCVRP